MKISNITFVCLDVALTSTPSNKKWIVDSPRPANTTYMPRGLGQLNIRTKNERKTKPSADMYEDTQEVSSSTKILKESNSESSSDSTSSNGKRLRKTFLEEKHTEDNLMLANKKSKRNFSFWSSNADRFSYTNSQYPPGISSSSSIFLKIER